MTGWDLLNLFKSPMQLKLQSEAGECGLACLAMVAGFHGLDLELSDVRGHFPVTLKGTTLEDITKIASQLNLDCRAVTVELNGLAYLRLPSILHWNFNHFVVLTHVGRNSITIYDPASGIRKVSLQKASESFTGVALELWPQPSFVKRTSSVKVGLKDLVGRITGLTRSVGQVIFLAFTLELLGLLSPLFLQLVLDKVIVASDSDLLAVLAIGFCLIMLMREIVFSVRQWALIYLSTSVSLQWRSNVFTHLLRLPLQYFERRFLADIVSRFGSIDNIQRTLATSFLEAILDGAMVLVTLLMMLVYDATLAGIAVAATVLYVFLRLIVHRTLRAASEKQVVCAARQHGHFLETVRGIKAIKLFQRVEVRHRTWVSLVADQMNASIEVQKTMVLTRLFNGVVYGLANIGIVWLGALAVLDGNFTVGVLVAFLAYKAQFDSRVSSVIDKLFDLRMLSIDYTRLSDIVLTAPEKNLVFSDETSRCPAEIELRNVRFRYSDGEPYIIDGVNLIIPAGQSIAIVGASGCGKSTLLSLLLGILEPAEGEILIGGVSLANGGAGAARAIIGSVSQDDTLFAGSISENISFFDTKPDPAWIRECAAAAAISQEIMLMPMRYNTRVGDMGTVLSGGQKQRILLARALYRKPRILLLDEATSNLDVLKEQQVNRAVRELQMTRVIVAHRQETIACADRVITLLDGKIVMDSLAQTA